MMIAVELVSVREIGEMVGRVTGTTDDHASQRGWHLARRKDFPKPLAQLRCGRIWRRRDVQAFLDAWVKAPWRPVTLDAETLLSANDDDVGYFTALLRLTRLKDSELSPQAWEIVREGLR